MFYAREQLTFHHAVVPHFVGNQDTRHIVQALPKPLEDVLGCSDIAAALCQNADYATVPVAGRRR